MIAARSAYLRVRHERGKIFAAGLIVTGIAVALVAAGFGLLAFLRSDAGSATALLNKLAEIIDGARVSLPEWLVEALPGDAEGLREALVAWLKDHAKELQHAGLETGRTLAHLLIGMVVGGMLSLAEVQDRKSVV